MKAFQLIKKQCELNGKRPNEGGIVRMSQYINPYEVIKFLNERLTLNLKTLKGLADFMKKHPTFPTAYNEYLQPLSREETIAMLNETNLYHH